MREISDRQGENKVTKSGTRDLTSGSPMKLIWQFAIPLIFGNLFQQLYNMVDTVIVGRALGLSALTAVGATGPVNFLIIGFALGTCNGFAIPVARQFGAKRYDSMRAYVMNAAYLSAGLAVVLTLLTTILCDNILTWMKTPAEIFQGSYDYFFVICLGIPFTILYNVVSGVIRALGDSKTPFYFLVLSTFLNIGLDFLFILGFQMGIAGAAWATITAQAVAGILCFLYMRRTYEVLRSNQEERRVRGRYLGELAWTAFPMGLQFSVTAIGSIMLQSAVNGLDVLYVSAFAAGAKVKQLAMCPFEALATACATFGSQNLGAGRIDRIRKGLGSGILIGFIYAVLMGILLVTAGSVIAWMFVERSEVEVLAEVQHYMTWLGVFFWMLAILNCTRMTIQGLGYSGIAVFAGISELIARGLVSLLLVPRLGFTGVCIADPAAWLAATLIVVPVFAVIIRKLGNLPKTVSRNEDVRISKNK